MPNSETLTLMWGLPFLGVLLSLALGPIFFKASWHKASPVILGILSCLTGVAVLKECGFLMSGSIFTHLMVCDFLPFILLIGALYIISGGILLEVSVKRSPLTNTLFLGVGTFFASFIGTTGAVILFIRPLIHVNKARLHKAHLIVFLIILVGNIGGSLTPLGDPPLFLGFLNGIDFMWVPHNMTLPFLLMALPLLGIFYAVDTFFLRKEHRREPHFHKKNIPWLKIQGKKNLALLLLLIFVVAFIQPEENSAHFVFMGVSIFWPNLLRDGLLMLLTLLSLWTTPYHIKSTNKFSWKPLLEVGVVSFAIFVTVMPVLCILEAKEEGALGFLIRILSDEVGNPLPVLYFWTTGLCSAFLDNAPTYLVYLKATGIPAKELMDYSEPLLLAISTGAVFMGALTYIGNAPNLLARAVAEEYAIKMPSFLTYSLIVGIILLPLFFVLSYLFFL